MTTYRLDFSQRHSYHSETAITVPITLISDIDTYVDFSASLDTGSTYCIFQRQCADWLELPLTSGLETRIVTATGSFHCYGHDLTLSVFELEWQAVVYFAEMEAFSLNVVGRAGFLDRLQIGIVDYEQLLYLGLYDQRSHSAGPRAASQVCLRTALRGLRCNGLLDFFLTITVCPTQLFIWKIMH